MTSLPLIGPVGTDFIKDWPFQNQINCDLIDAAAGPNSLVSHPLGTYTPIWTALTTPGSLATTVTSANIFGYYYMLFDMVYTWGYFRFGTGFSVGSGTYTVTLPFQVKSTITQSNNMGGTSILGNAYIWDESAAAARQPANVQVRADRLSLMFGMRMGSGAASSEVTAVAPITWAIDDGISWHARYQRS